MSLLLNSDDDPYSDENEPVLSSHTEEALFGETAYRSKAKKAERKARAEERKATTKPGNWMKQKDNVVTVQDKTPKKVKGQSVAKTMKTPPDSPKSVRPSEVKGNKGGAVGVAQGQLQQPSPNVKSQRKRYSQLDSGSSDEGGEGFLLSNAPALRDDTDSSKRLLGQSSNPFLVDQPSLFSEATPPSVFSKPAFVAGGLGVTGLNLADQPWLPKTTPTFPDISSPFPDISPSRPGHAPSPPPALQMGGQVRLSPPNAAVQDFTDTNPFLPPTGGVAPFQLAPAFNAPPPPTTEPLPTQPSSLLPQAPSSPPATTVPVLGLGGGAGEDWSISEDLRCKCVQQFRDLEPVKGLLQGDKAREFFVQSKLPNQELSAIWRLSDMDQDNALSEQEFCIAMKLVLMRRKGTDIPSALPHILLNKDHTRLELPGVPDHTSSSSSPSLLSTLTTDQTSPTHPTESLLDMHAQQSAPELARVPSPGYNLLTDQDELLVDIGDEEKTTPTSPHPRVGHIISIEESSLGVESGLGSESRLDEESQEESSVLMKGSSGSDTEDRKDIRPVRPAPPKPRPLKSSSQQPVQPRPYKKKSLGKADTSSPPTDTHSPQDDTVPMLVNTKAPPPAKPPRPSAFAPVPPTKKSAYSTLVTSPPSVGPHPPAEEQGGGEGESGFNWTQLVGEGGPSSSADEASEKGHSRSTSLDLNKMLLGHAAAGDVLGGVPSAVPPKPPPKHKASSPPPAGLLVGVDEEEESWAVISPTHQLRPRSLSTGSMASTGGGGSSGGVLVSEDPPYLMDTSADALLLVQHRTPPPKAPKPKKVPILPPGVKPSSKTVLKTGGTSKSGDSGGSAAPASGQAVSKPSSGATSASKRPPAPSKPSNKLADFYQAGMETGGGRVGLGLGGTGDSSGVVVKDKLELQSSIRSLKENNEALVDINKNLEEKLFKLMEERVRLARELHLLSGLT